MSVAVLPAFFYYFPEDAGGGRTHDCWSDGLVKFGLEALIRLTFRAFDGILDLNWEGCIHLGLNEPLKGGRDYGNVKYL